MSHHTPRSHPAVSVSGLWKRYGATEAVCGITFEINPGQIVGLLGPNGAGKTTTLECILGLRQPDAGTLRVNGLDLATQAAAAKRVLGAQLQAATLQEKITPRQALDLFGSFYRDCFSTGELLCRFDLQSKADVSFSTLSGGQRQRLFLALALVNRPAVLVLDEPTAGLDPQARLDLRCLIGGVRAEGRTVLLSTHDLDEAAELCDQVAILDAGRIVAMAKPRELIGRSQVPARIAVRTSPSPGGFFNSLAGVLNVTPSGSEWILETRAPNLVLADLVRRAGDAGIELLGVELRRPTLEDVFLELTGRPWSRGSMQAGVP